MEDTRGSPRRTPSTLCLTAVLRALLEPGLHATIRVMDQPGEGLGAAPDGHLQGVQGEVGAQRGGDAPADDAPRVHVGDERRVGEPAPRGDVGDVGDPQLVGSVGDEAALDEIGLGGWAIGGDRRASPPASGAAGQAHVAHQAFHRAASHPHTVTVELAPHLAGPVDAVVGGMDPSNRRLHGLVAEVTLARLAPLGGVVAGWGDLQHTTDRLDPETVPMSVHVADYLCERRSSSAPKKAAAVFKIGGFRRWPQRPVCRPLMVSGSPASCVVGR